MSLEVQEADGDLLQKSGVLEPQVMLHDLVFPLKKIIIIKKDQGCFESHQASPRPSGRGGLEQTLNVIWEGSIPLLSAEERGQAGIWEAGHHRAGKAVPLGSAFQGRCCRGWEGKWLEEVLEAGEVSRPNFLRKCRN